MNKRRLLITACGGTKRPDAGLLPAIERYDGPSFRMLRKTLGQLSDEQRPTVLILSAKFGLIEADRLTPDYDQRMTPEQASRLAPQVDEALDRLLRTATYTHTLFHMGKAYLAAMDIAPWKLSHMGRIAFTTGGIGMQMSQMKHWLIEKPWLPARLPQVGQIVEFYSGDRHATYREHGRVLHVHIPDPDHLLSHFGGYYYLIDVETAHGVKRTISNKEIVGRRFG
ncbi:MAG: hypothetical protein EI684_15160 [Candidatus Viridilinea halotolerans]|uniref:DUF6884 domain-containing protein n=1 Tax=Candidatus Viridilinea halotolerans TaxID=2491704 RepID=A0A426TVY6_9CHLR|nr:MAG: hypothetical protein EI684_15160 [Candidatus Viridilinea halotolerans]